MCSRKCVIAIKVMASAVFLLVSTVAVYRDQNFRACGYNRYHHLDKDNCSTFADVLENRNSGWTESSSSGPPTDSLSLGLLHTDDLIVVSDKLKDILNGFPKFTMFPILTAEAQPEEHFHRFPWNPRRPNRNNIARNLTPILLQMPLAQPADDQQVPDVDDAVEPPPERSHDHVVPVVAAGSLLRRDEQLSQDWREQVVPRVPNFGQNQDRMNLPPEEPEFQDLEGNQIVPQADDEPTGNVIRATDRQEVNDPFLENLPNLFHIASAVLPWMRPHQSFLLPESQEVQGQLERFRAQSRALEAMAHPVPSL